MIHAIQIPQGSGVIFFRPFLDVAWTPGIGIPRMVTVQHYFQHASTNPRIGFDRVAGEEHDRTQETIVLIKHGLTRASYTRMYGAVISQLLIKLKKHAAPKSVRDVARSTTTRNK